MRGHFQLKADIPWLSSLALKLGFVGKSHEFDSKLYRLNNNHHNNIERRGKSNPRCNLYFFSGNSQLFNKNFWLGLGLTKKEEKKKRKIQF
jgi:hypothetical protein